MKKKLLFSFWFLCLFISIQAQTNYGYNKGIIATQNGDSINCWIELAVSYDSYVNYKQYESDDKPKRFKTKDIQWMELPNSYHENIKMGKSEKLVSLITAGKVYLYKYIESNQRSGNSPIGNGTVSFFNFTEHFVIKKDTIFYEISSKKFKENVKEFFGDCEKLTKKIDSGEFKIEHMQKIVSEYNRCDD